MKFQEFKRKISEEQRKVENKRKRQISIRKRKNSEAKNMLKEFIEERDDNSVEEHIVNEKEMIKERDGEGPGYIGWRIVEKESKTLEDGADMKRVSEDIKCLFNLYKGMEDKLKVTTKEMNSLKREVKDVKEEHKRCLDALAKETYERNKAEEMNKVLLESIDADRRLNNAYNIETDENSAKDMSVDETEEIAFTQQQKLSKKKQHHCNLCEKKFSTTTEMDSHVKEIHADKAELHFKCNKCDRKFLLEGELNEHTVTFHAERVFNCQICNKPYTSMSLLRRHDWRSHRKIECNLCGETLENRQEIKKHRERKHQIYQKTYCKFFPNCMDGEECLFEHELDSNEASYCPNGRKCDDQTCKYSEQMHLTTKMLCKFQANCNRLNCPYTHNVDRKAFLGEGVRRIIRN